MEKRHVYVCCSLDVEEEGLFRGSYRVTSPPVCNLAFLHRMQPLLDMGLHATLFCAHSVLAEPAAWSHVETLAAKGGVEVGLHLHHWNTPPLADPSLTQVRAVPSALVDPNLMAAKLDCLMELGKKRLGRAPTSFRMGRWDLHACHWEMLARAGITADASVRPLHEGSAASLGPDHFSAPHSPYLVQTAAGSIFELPLTVTHLSPWITAAVRRMPQAVRASLQKWGALALLPVYHPLWAMQAITALAIARGTTAISLTWHSSELMAGANPVLPKDKDIKALLKKVRNYLAWLQQRYTLTFVTLGELEQALRTTVPQAVATRGDWSGEQF